MTDKEKEKEVGGSDALRRLGKLGSVSEMQGKGVEDGGGRKAIVVLFFLTIGLCLIFWLQGNFISWLRDLLGPSTWTYSR